MNGWLNGWIDGELTPWRINEKHSLLIEKRLNLCVRSPGPIQTPAGSCDMR